MWERITPRISGTYRLDDRILTLPEGPDLAIKPVTLTVKPRDGATSETQRITGLSTPRRTLEWTVTWDHLARVPRWDGRSEPPLSMAEAVRIAREAHAAGSDTPDAFLPRFLSRSLIRMGPRPGRSPFWYYSLRDSDVDEPVVILMDGHIVEPTVYDRPQ